MSVFSRYTPRRPRISLSIPIRRGGLILKKFLRRSGAALLAACTVWVVAATVESRSLPAAAEAMRESFQLPKALVQLELGDVLGGMV